MFKIKNISKWISIQDDDLSFGNVLQLLDLLSIMVTNNTTSF